MIPLSSSTPRKTIGILGGMGPAASAHIYERLIEITQAQYHASTDEDFPAMVLYSLPLRDWDTTGFLDMDSVRRQLIAGVRKLEAAGSDFIIIACNTVHHFYPDMQSAVRIPILNMVEETVTRVSAQGLGAVGVLATTSSSKLGVYQSVLSQHGIDVITMTPEQQEHVTGVIGHAEGGNLTRRDTVTLRRIIRDLQSRGAKGIILGCTELPLAIKQADVDVPLFNTSDIIAEEAIREAYRPLPVSCGSKMRLYLPFARQMGHQA